MSYHVNYRLFPAWHSRFSLVWTSLTFPSLFPFPVHCKPWWPSNSHNFTVVRERPKCCWPALFVMAPLGEENKATQYTLYLVQQWAHDRNSIYHCSTSQASDEHFIIYIIRLKPAKYGWRLRCKPQRICTKKRVIFFFYSNEQRHLTHHMNRC